MTTLGGSSDLMCQSLACQKVWRKPWVSRVPDDVMVTVMLRGRCVCVCVCVCARCRSLELAVMTCAFNAMPLGKFGCHDMCIQCIDMTCAFNLMPLGRIGCHDMCIECDAVWKNRLS
jgi:hypothetical protein